MNLEKLKQIKARCEAAEEVGANLHHTVVRACLDEIERVRGKVQALLDHCQTSSDERCTVYFVQECELYEIIEGD